jgi:hypothetical protein
MLLVVHTGGVMQVLQSVMLRGFFGIIFPCLFSGGDRIFIFRLSLAVVMFLVPLLSGNPVLLSYRVVM